MSTSLEDRIHAIIKPLADELEDLQHKRAQLIDARVEMDRQIARIEKVIRVADPENAKPRATTATAPKRKQRKVGRERLKRVLAWCKEQGNETFTQVALRDEIQMDSASTAYAFAELRDEGYIRLTGRDETRANVYRNIEGSPDTLPDEEA